MTATNAMNMSRKATVTPTATGAEVVVGTGAKVVVGTGAKVVVGTGAEVVGAAVAIVVGTAKQRSILVKLLCVSINMTTFYLTER